ncbi:MAG: T9SS type A sorting domain-containing protein [Bacteroidetes bacterium]|nr:T9SS type A sorting domain-containing protein [Bacteroidota bacterium]
MKKLLPHLLVLMILICITGSISAQSYHFKEGFATNTPPTGWVMTNVSYSTTHNHDSLTGVYAAKMKPNESFVMFKALNTAADLAFFIQVRDTTVADNFHFLIEKSTNKVDWTQIGIDPCNMLDDSTWQPVTIHVNDAAPELYIRFHATAVGGTNTLGLAYVDDISVTKLEANPSDATLIDFSYNGIPVPGFTAATLTYNIEVPYSVEHATVAGSPNNASATVAITQPTNLRGYEADRTGTVTVTSADGTTVKSYKIIFTVSDYIYKIGFSNTGDGVMPLSGWRGGYTYTSITIPLGNHGTFPGDAALKFMRGQPDKIGYLNTAKYIKSDTLSFWLSVSDPDGVEQLRVEKKVLGGVSVPLGIITSADMSSSEWKLFTYPIKEDDSCEIILTPTLTAEGITRIWIDDLAMKGKHVSGLSVPDADKIQSISVFPNPASDQLFFNTKGENYNSLTVFDFAGNRIYNKEISRKTTGIDVSALQPGIYLIRFEGITKTTCARFVKE